MLLGGQPLYHLSYNRLGDTITLSPVSAGGLEPPASDAGALAKLSHTERVAVGGFEPPASGIPSRRAGHAALHHEKRPRAVTIRPFGCDRAVCTPVHHEARTAIALYDGLER